MDPLQTAVLERLLAGDTPVLTALRGQAEKGRLASNRYTGVGFFCDLDIPANAPRIVSHPNFAFGDVFAELQGLKHGASFVLFVRDGFMTMLEGFSFDEPWPKELRKFVLTGGTPPRDTNLPSEAVIDWGG